MLGPTLHENFMLVLAALIVGVFIAVVALEIRHRRVAGPAAGSWLAWLWLGVPFAILLTVSFVLVQVPAP